jgi:hypothetical protein
MSIKVEMPQFWIYKPNDLCPDDCWVLTDKIPDSKYGFWSDSNGSRLHKQLTVIGFKGSWKESLHHWNGTEWIKDE